MEVKAQIEEIVNGLITEPNLFLVEVNIGSYNKTTRVSVILDGDEGIGIDECAILSRELGQKLEELAIFDVAYTLEVSSPGIDKPLKLKRQYFKNIGRNIKVVKKDGTTFIGVLTEVKEETILLKQEKKIKSKVEVTDHLINFEEIKSTTIVISFN